jgi:hypothetical protein
LPPFPFCPGVGRGESLVELLLEDTGGTANLGWSGGSQVAGVDLRGGAPHLDVGDQLCRQRGMALDSPRRCYSCSVEADLVGELSNKL